MPFSAVRMARQLGRIRSFYEQVDGLAVISIFADPDGFDGPILAVQDERMQLELVHSPHGGVPSPSVDDARALNHRSIVPLTR